MNINTLPEPELDSIILNCTSSIPSHERSPSFVNTIKRIREQTLRAYDTALSLNYNQNQEAPHIIEVLLGSLEEFKTQNNQPETAKLLLRFNERIYRLYFH
jgi:hypothetical protein